MKVYIPLLYSEKVKRPDKRYFLNNIIGEDFIIIILSFAYSSSHVWYSIIGLFLLQMAFWCIYELGYIENDVIGEKFEDKAILSYNYKSYEISFGSWQPWLWSLCLSVPGVVLLLQDKTTKNIALDFIPNEYSRYLFLISQELICWLIFLIILRILFYIYNHVNKQSRIWLYLPLQVCRYCGFLVIISTNIVGLMFALSSVLTRSIQYILYRYLGGKISSWPMDFPRYFFSFLIFIILTGTVAANDRNLSLILNPQVLFIFVFCLLRGSKHFYNVCIQFVPVSKDGSNQIS